MTIPAKITRRLTEIIQKLESPYASRVFVAADYSKQQLIDDLRELVGIRPLPEALPEVRVRAIKEAAEALHKAMNGDGHYRASIGTAREVIHVYVHMQRSLWRGEVPRVWQGFPLRWHWGVGRARAL